MVEFPSFPLVDIVKKTAKKMECPMENSQKIPSRLGGVSEEKPGKNPVRKKARKIISLTLPVMSLPIKSFPVTSLVHQAIRHKFPPDLT